MSENICCGNCKHGWTKITPDNVGNITKELAERTIVGFIFDGSLIHMPCLNCMDRLSSFARMGSYYYFTLPELNTSDE